uniref:Putative ovule protein n=1 Tax=Solanum chacoense TaxID=4108 RepID=A0A0V0HBY5_SOLCH
MSFQRKQQKTINSQKVLLRCNLLKFFFFNLGVQYSIWSTKELKRSLPKLIDLYSSSSPIWLNF